MALPLAAIASLLPAVSGLLGGGGSQTTANNSLVFGASLSPTVNVVVQGEGGASSDADVDGAASSEVIPSLTNTTTPADSLLTGSAAVSSGYADPTYSASAYSASAASSDSLFTSPLVIGGGALLVFGVYYFTRG